MILCIDAELFGENYPTGVKRWRSGMVVLHDNGVRRDSCSNEVSVDPLSQINYAGLNSSQRTSFLGSG